MHLRITVVQRSLDESGLFLKNIQSTVNIMKFIRWRFQKTAPVFQRRALGTRIQNSRIDQIPENLSKIRLKAILFLYLLTGFLSPEILEYLLKKQISTVERGLLIGFQLLLFGKRD